MRHGTKILSFDSTEAFIKLSKTLIERFYYFKIDYNEKEFQSTVEAENSAAKKVKLKKHILYNWYICYNYELKRKDPALKTKEH